MGNATLPVPPGLILRPEYARIAPVVAQYAVYLLTVTSVQQDFTNTIIAASLYVHKGSMPTVQAAQHVTPAAQHALVHQ